MFRIVRANQRAGNKGLQNTQNTHRADNGRGPADHAITTVGARCALEDCRGAPGVEAAGRSVRGRWSRLSRRPWSAGPGPRSAAVPRPRGGRTQGRRHSQPLSGGARPPPCSSQAHAKRICHGPGRQPSQPTARGPAVPGPGGSLLPGAAPDAVAPARASNPPGIMRPGPGPGPAALGGTAGPCGAVLAASRSHGIARDSDFDSDRFSPLQTLCRCDGSSGCTPDSLVERTPAGGERFR
jgi:hypothetical protein